MESRLYLGDCLDICRSLPADSFALAYVDPPFFSGREHVSSDRSGAHRYAFDDSWGSLIEYKEFLADRICAVRGCLSQNGSIIVHCDKSASHHVRCILEDLFGFGNFRSEIIWTYKRWSNSRKGLMPAHQTLFWYSVSEDYEFHNEYGSYSPTTNIDQILQLRTRDERNKSVYARTADGAIVYGAHKKGVPLSDVWDIPFLNPKAKERVGYPTQKPVELLVRVIRMVTSEGDAILDPFCGSGSSLVAAKCTGRDYVGIDISPGAISLSEDRLANPVVTQSVVSAKGRESFNVQDEFVRKVLAAVDCIPVQRNAGIDAIIPAGPAGQAVFLRVQRPTETLAETIESLKRGALSKGSGRLAAIRTRPDLFGEMPNAHDVEIVDSIEFSLLKAGQSTRQSAA